MNPGTPDIPRPPYDPLFTLLDARVGWRAKRLYNVEPAFDGALQLKTPPPEQQKLADGIGAFGGLTLATGNTRDSTGNLFRLDSNRSLISRFDPCQDRYEVVPHTGGIGKAPRQLYDAHGLACFGGDIFVCDTGNQRVQVFCLNSWVLRTIWVSPTSVSWAPFGIVFDDSGRAFISDRSNNVVDCFDRQGQKIKTFCALHRPTHLTIDRAGLIYVAQEGLDDIAVFMPDGTAANPPFVQHVSQVKDRFCRGSLDQAVSASFATKGHYISEPIDSGIDHCVWHRIMLDSDIPHATQIRIDTYTSETEFGPDPLDDLAAGWLPLPQVTQTADRLWDALIVSPPGRYLWLRIHLIGRSTATPRIRRIKVEYPRISLRRWLPAVFGTNSHTADFSDRMLAVFDTQFRDIEAKICGFASCLDPLGAPAGVSSHSDWLGWLASWLNLTLDRTWPEERRRRWLREASSLYRVRGTTEGLQRQLLLLMGWTGDAAKAPVLILEHYKLRRWLYLGQGRLGEQSVLWGMKLLACPQSHTETRLGSSVLPSSSADEKDFIEQHAYRFTVFVPSSVANDPGLRAAVERVVALHAPAHTVYRMETVAPRCRIGIQCSIGLNSVVGRYPQSLPLASERLGQDSVLHVDGKDLALKNGAGSRVGSTTYLS